LSEPEDRDHLYVTCTPWLFFTAFEHPIARYGNASIPNIAVGQFKFEDGGVRFPLAVQAHHGLVDGLHIHQLIEKITDRVGSLF
jgi:chloramphenicol O-acetyltransferase type A